MDVKIIDKLDNFFGKYKQLKYRKSEIIIRAGDNPSGVFYLREGIVREYAISEKGEEIIVNIFKPISFFPMSWAINGTPNSYFFEAGTNLNIIRAPKEDVIAFIKQEPEIVYDLLSRVYKGSDGLLIRMTYLMAGNAHTRLIAELIILAKRFGQKNGKEISVPAIEKDLAMQIGMTRETVSREMKVLKERKLVTFERSKLVIKNIDKFEEELFSEF